MDINNIEDFGIKQHEDDATSASIMVEKYKEEYLVPSSFTNLRVWKSLSIQWYQKVHFL